MRSLVQARWKRARAVQLAVEGQSFDQIAREVGYTHRGSAHRAVYRALAEQEVAAVAELRELEVARLDALQVRAWDQAMAGDLKAMHIILRVIDQRTRLLGLAEHGKGTVAGPQYLVTPH